MRRERSVEKKQTFSVKKRMKKAPFRLDPDPDLNPGFC
jgi:hypothetical protein